jgi:hypothetical protein
MAYPNAMVVSVIFWAVEYPTMQSKGYGLTPFNLYSILNVHLVQVNLTDDLICYVNDDWTKIDQVVRNLDFIILIS